MEVQK